MSVGEEVAKLKKEISEREAKVRKIEALAVEFPDLKRHVGRWGKEAYSSKSVNPHVTDYDMRRNCGCCWDSPLEIWTYVETVNGKVYSDPACFQVGESKYSGGYRPYDGWDTTMRKAGIPEEVIKRVGYHFNDDDDDDDDDDDFELDPIV